MRRAAAAGAAAVLAGMLTVALLIVPAASGRSTGRGARDAREARLQAVADAYQTANVGTLAVRRRDGLLANDSGGPLQLISHTEPTHGSLTLKPDGAFEYVPAAGFVSSYEETE